MPQILSTGRGRAIKQGIFSELGLYRRAMQNTAGAPAVMMDFWFPIAYAGTQALVYDVAQNGGVQGIHFAVPCIPGQTYTTSIFVRQSVRNYQQMSVATLVTGSSGKGRTIKQGIVSESGLFRRGIPRSQSAVVADDYFFGSPTGMIETDLVTVTSALSNVYLSWTRLSVTFTACQPKHEVFVQVVGTKIVNGRSVYDGIQHEIGTSVSAWSLTGPTIYGVFSGFVERWPSSWLYQGTFGQAQITCVDALAIMSGQFLDTEYTNSVLAKKPDLYWRLNEGSGATSFAETSGNGGPPLIFVPSKYGAGTAPSPGSSMGIPGDPAGGGVQFAAGTLVQTTPQRLTTGTSLGCGTLAHSPGISVPPGGGSTDWAMTGSCWFKANTSPPAEVQILFEVVTYAANLNNPEAPLIVFINFTGTASAQMGVGFIGVSNDSLINVEDQKLHHIAVVGSQAAAGNSVLKIYLDGSLITTSSVVTNTIGMLGQAATNVCVGARHDFTSYTQQLAATVAHLAFWNRELSADEISDLYDAGNTGYSFETTGLRTQRYLSYHYTKPTSIDTFGTSFMGVSNLAQHTTLFDAIQNNATTENGRFFVNSYGIVEFRSRTSQYLKTTPTWVFGENAAAGEIPYQGDIAFDFDPTLVYNDVQVTNAGGIVAHGGTPAAIKASQNDNGVRSFDRTVDAFNNLEVQDAADWIFGTHQSARQRVTRLTINPAANPAIWSAALGARYGDRATVKRRTAAGYIMSADFFIERIEHSRSPGVWTVTFQMSPVSQPWVLNDPTLSVLGATTVLGY